MVGWGCQKPLHPFSSPRAEGGVYGAARSFLSQTCSSAHQAFNLDLDPTAPAACVPPAMALSKPPHLSFSSQVPSAQLCPKDWGAVSPPQWAQELSFCGAPAGVFSLWGGHLPQPPAFLPHQPEARVTVPSAPRTGSGPLALPRGPGWASTGSRGSHHGRQRQEGQLWAKHGETTTGTSSL